MLTTSLSSVRLFLVGVMILMGIAGGCKRGGTAPPPPPPAVTFSLPLQREVIEWDEYTGNLESPETVDLRSRVSGLITEAKFKEGDVIEAGKTLFKIDVSPYQADLEAKRAAVTQSEAQVALSQSTLNRTKVAQPGGAVSQQELDTAVANLLMAQGQLAGAKAAQDASQLNVTWCNVVAPITGRVSRKDVTVGNLVTGGTAAGTLLTSLRSIDPIYTYVYADEQSVLKYLRLINARRMVSAREAYVPCFMQLSDEKNYPHEGYIDFVDNQVDPNTGTLRVRGVFPNPTKRLLPGFFARMRIAGSGRYNAVLIPDLAVGTDLNQRFVLVVGPNDVVSNHRVTLGTLFGKLRVIEEGIAPGDRVIVNGFQRVRDGMKVEAKEQPIPPEMFELTAKGSATTQQLPELRSMPAVTGNAATLPTTFPTTPPTSLPTSAPASMPTSDSPSSNSTSRNSTTQVSPAENRQP